MIWLVGSITKLGENGVVIDAGEGRRCNIYVKDEDQIIVGVQVGQRVRVMAEPRWVKRNGNFALEFSAIKFDVK